MPRKKIWKIPQTKSQTKSIFNLRGSPQAIEKAIVFQELEWRAKQCASNQSL
jgi:molybdopterin biosynthesis enzyme MoaB